MHEKIRNDTFRTLATDRKFHARVDEAELVRILNAFANAHADDRPDRRRYAARRALVAAPPNRPLSPPLRPLRPRFSYVQGMNVLLAPFLYVMPELDAYDAWSTLLLHHCPLYVQPALDGVHAGLRLLDECLQVVDAKLAQHLRDKGLTAVRARRRWAAWL